MFFNCSEYLSEATVKKETIDFQNAKYAKLLLQKIDILYAQRNSTYRSGCIDLYNFTMAVIYEF